MNPVTVQQILKVKGNKLVTIAPEDSAFVALEKMAKNNLGALLVMKDNNLTGIFSERDYARKVILLGKASKETPVSEIMTQDLTTVSPEMTTDDCMTFMTDKHIRHLPVIEDGKLVGLISIGDVVHAIISEQDSEIKQLKDYISGGG